MSIEISKYLPTPSDRMGALWTLTPIENIFVVEYGPAGTTHFSIESVFNLGAQINMHVYTTHMSDADITFGNTDKLQGAIFEIVEKFSPKYIFVFASSISALIGVDIANFCAEIQSKINCILIPITSGGYDGDFNVGIENMLEIISKEIVKEPKTKKLNTYNIIGNTIDSFNFQGDLIEIESILKNVYGQSLNCCFTSFSNLESLEKASEAQCNIVIRAEGIKAAKYMFEKYGIDYVYQKPYGYCNTLSWLQEISKKWGFKVDSEKLLSLTKKLKEILPMHNNMLRNVENRDVLISGDFDTVVGMYSMCMEMGLNPYKLLVNHSLNKTTIELLNNLSFKDKIICKPTELEIINIFKENVFYFVFGNAAIKAINNKNNFMIISNPNLDLHNFYPYTPLVGFNGCLYILQILMNKNVL